MFVLEISSKGWVTAEIAARSTAQSGRDPADGSYLSC